MLLGARVLSGCDAGCEVLSEHGVDSGEHTHQKENIGSTFISGSVLAGAFHNP